MNCNLEKAVKRAIEGPGAGMIVQNYPVKIKGHISRNVRITDCSLSAFLFKGSNSSEN